LSNIYFVIIWAFFPATLLLPIELILHKVLLMNIANTLILSLLLLIIIWFFFRMLKGIYVLFDVSPFYVYFYSFALIFIIAGIVIIKYQITHSIIYFIVNSYNQFISLI